MRKSYSFYSLLTLTSVFLFGNCSIIAEVDRTKIPQDAGTTPGDGGEAQGGSGARGGSAGDSGTGGNAGAGEGGIGGDAGGDTGGSSGDAGMGGTDMGGAGMGGAGTGGAASDECGNGMVESGEDCDDGDMPPAGNDGCSATCLEETGWGCTGEPSVCVTTCGDGVMAGTEACDDGNSVACGTCNVGCTMATPSAAATGTISPGSTAPGDIDDTDYFILNDGVNPPVEFEFDAAPGNGASRAGAIEIDFDPTGTPAELQTAIVSAINSVTTAPSLAITAAASGTVPNVTLTNDTPGTVGNQTTGNFVTNTSFMITPMTGGAAHDCPAATGCKVPADCASGTCTNDTCG